MSAGEEVGDAGCRNAADDPAQGEDQGLATKLEGAGEWRVRVWAQWQIQLDAVAPLGRLSTLERRQFA